MPVRPGRRRITVQGSQPCVVLWYLLLSPYCRGGSATRRWPRQPGFREQLSGLLPTTCVSGQPFQLDASASYYTLLFLGVECPVARQYGARVQELANQFSDQKIQFIGINSNPQDSRSKVAQYQTDFGIEFPLLKDHSQAIAKRFEATRTAEAIVVDATGTIRYRGRIDDQFSPGEPATRSLRTI